MSRGRERPAQVMVRIAGQRDDGRGVSCVRKTGPHVLRVQNGRQLVLTQLCCMKSLKNTFSLFYRVFEEMMTRKLKLGSLVVE